ncbi:MAG TPA: 5'-3' exonuclease H3TH domain-containing protein [Acidimicrobiales bacterium]|jgi:5'-3' exonuclease|nr:5'-3' exonuclease H3TH domain-containing protein [Acidimicrobiales bacterium]
MKAHLVDGTYELFRYHFAPNNKDPDLGATRGVLGSVLQLLESGATHVGVATDHIIESFRNDLWPGYKTSAGMPPDLLAQFSLIEEVLSAAGIATWPMVELEADDALGAAARVAAADARVTQVLICTPDKDLGQCVGGKVVQWDRRRDLVFDANGVREKFGVGPASIPDYLALVGDSADGFPGLAGWGSKTAAAVLAKFEHLEAIPSVGEEWGVGVRNPGRLAATLREHFDLALLFRRIATIEVDAPVIASVDELEWKGPTKDLIALSEKINGVGLAERAIRLAERRAR